MTTDQKYSPLQKTPTHKFTYEFDPKNVKLNEALIYKWTIRDTAGVIVGVYIGKAKGGESRPRKHYGRNVNNILAGKPYRKGRDTGFRRVHRSLADAIKSGYKIKLEFICNVGLDEDINAVEQFRIKEANSRGTADWQLNG